MRAAQHNNGAGPRSDDEVIIQDSDAAFLAKLLAVSFAGGLCTFCPCHRPIASWPEA